MYPPTATYQNDFQFAIELMVRVVQIQGIELKTAIDIPSAYVQLVL